MSSITESGTGGRATAELTELIQFIRETVPQPKEILELQIKDPPGVAYFRWHQREYIVNPALQVFELKGKDVFVTASSMLLQAALMRKRGTSKVLEVAVQTLHQVEEFIKGRSIDKGVLLLASVKKTISGLSGR